jgi:membrane protein
MKKYNKFIKWLPVSIVLQTYKNWRSDRTLRLGAGIAYYGVFAIVPLVTIMFSVAALFFSSESVTNYLNQTASRFFGNDLSGSFSQIIDKINTESATTVLSSASILGFVVLIFSASFIFVAFQDALDAIWHNPVRLGWLKWIRKYAIAYSVVLVVSLLLLAALIITSLGSFIETNFPLQFQAIDLFTNFATRVSIGVVFILFVSVFYKLLIYEKVKWTILIFTSFITSLFLVIGTWLLGIYISNYASTSLSGAIGAVLLVLIWIYYEAQIILVGAQLIKTLQLNYKKLPKIIFR